MDQPLYGQRILIVEDDFVSALDLRRLVEDWGGQVVGPAGRADEALKLAQSERLDGAILDIKLQRGDSLRVADALAKRKVPIIVASGYDASALPEPLRASPKLDKPFVPAAGQKLMREVFARRRSR